MFALAFALAMPIRKGPAPHAGTPKRRWPAWAGSDPASRTA